MKIITKTYEVYEYAELTSEAKHKALNAWNENKDISFIQSMLNDECGQLLKKAGIACTSNHPICLYSLSSCQGDGLMFEGTFKWKDYGVTIKHTGRYYHSGCKNMDMENTKEETLDYEKPFREFNDIYVKICNKLEKLGYTLIEDEMSEAHFIDDCNANEWTFTSDGKMLNA
jgi:hypothetical protein